MLVSDLRLYYLLQLAAHQVKKVADARLSCVADITTAQAAVLSLVSDHGPVTQRALARDLRQNESAITAMANRLLKLGYIARVRSTEDARAWQLTTTPEGEAALLAIGPAFKDVNTVLAGELDDADIRALASQLQAVISRFDEA